MNVALKLNYTVLPYKQMLLGTCGAENKNSNCMVC